MFLMERHRTIYTLQREKMKDNQHEQLFQELGNEVAATCSAGAAKLYKDDGFSPKPKTFNIGTKDLRGFGFNDETSSLVLNETWVFYPDINFRGTPVSLTKGSYNKAQLESAGIKNDSISSLRIATRAANDPIFG